MRRRRWGGAKVARERGRQPEGAKGQREGETEKEGAKGQHRQLCRPVPSTPGLHVDGKSSRQGWKAPLISSKLK